MEKKPLTKLKWRDTYLVHTFPPGQRGVEYAVGEKEGGEGEGGELERTDFYYKDTPSPTRWE